MYTHARTHTHALDGSAAVHLALFSPNKKKIIYRAKAVVYYSIHKSGFLKFLCSMYCGSCSMYFLNFIMTHPFYSFILLNTALWILRFSVMTNDALLRITLSRKNVAINSKDKWKTFNFVCVHISIRGCVRPSLRPSFRCLNFPKTVF